jgi:hypothetical protein
MAASIWSRKFDEPIPLPRGRRLVTLRDAGNYILKLSERRAKDHAPYGKVDLKCEQHLRSST